MDLQGPLRLFRAAVLTAMAVSLAAAGHVLGGGQLPDAGTVAGTAAVLLPPAAWLAQRQLSFLALLAVLGAGQITLHAAFAVFSPGASCLPQLPLAQLQGSLALNGGLTHPGHAGGLGCTAAAAVAAPMDVSSNSPAMLAGHFLAMLATAWLLRKGETALWQLLAWLRPLVQLPRSNGIIPARPRPAAWPTVILWARRRNLRHDTLRGPPLAALPRTSNNFPVPG